MKLLDLCLVSNADMVIYEGHFGIEIARIDGKNGVSTPLLDSEICYLSVNNDWLHIEVDFSVYEFIRDNFDTIYKNLIENYIEYSESINCISIRIVKRLGYEKDFDMYLVNDTIYTKYQLKAMILEDSEYLLHITKNWNNYEVEWDL